MKNLGKLIENADMFNDLSSGCNQIHLSCQFPKAAKHEGAFLINNNTLIGNGYCVDLYPA